MLATLRMKVATTFYRRLVLYARSTDPADEDTPLPDGFRFAALQQDELTEYLAMRPRIRATTLETRIQRGDTCFGVWDGDELVHAAWVATGPGRGRVEYLRGFLSLGQEHVYVYDTFTKRARRGEGIAVLRDTCTRTHFSKFGHLTTLTLVAPENEAGLRTISASAYRPLGTYRVVRLGSWQRLLESVEAVAFSR